MKDPWEVYAAQLLKDLMYWRRVSYRQLSERLAGIGIDESAKQLTNKINRGQFAFTFFLVCLEALEFKLSDAPWATLEEGVKSPARLPSPPESRNQ